jgi:hypothetical protein
VIDIDFFVGTVFSGLPALVIEDVTESGGMVVVAARTQDVAVRCPVCGTAIFNTDHGDIATKQLRRHSSRKIDMPRTMGTHKRVELPYENHLMYRSLIEMGSAGVTALLQRHFAGTGRVEGAGDPSLA